MRWMCPIRSRPELSIILSQPMLTRRELLAGLAAVSLSPHRKGKSHTMDQRISIVTLGVKDLSISKRFYSDGLGWKPAFENKEIIFFQTGGMVLALFLRDKLAADFQAIRQPSDGQPWHLLTMCAQKARWIRS